MVPVCLCVVVFNEHSEIAAGLFIQQWKKKTNTEIRCRIMGGIIGLGVGVRTGIGLMMLMMLDNDVSTTQKRAHNVFSSC